MPGCKRGLTYWIMHHSILKCHGSFPTNPITPFFFFNNSTSPNGNLSADHLNHLKFPPCSPSSFRSTTTVATAAADYASSSSLSDMSAVGSSMFPLHRCKTLHLVRHAQGVHNVEGEKDHSAYMSHHLFDAHLTPLGWDQVHNLRKHVIACGLSKKVELVITSPLTRTMQTAVGVFGGESIKDGVDVPPLMVKNAGNSDHYAISSLNCPPFMAVEACREHLGVHPCDKRRSIQEYKPLFPAIDFSLIENDEDVLWQADIREKNSEVAARGMKFIDWLWTRPEKEIAIVTHSGFLFHTLQEYAANCHPVIKDEIGKHFANCELRSMVLVDKSVLGSDAPVNNYPGKIPAGSDLPSDVAP